INPIQSATSAGFSSPSISTVTLVRDCSSFGLRSFASASTKRPRTRLPALTGDEAELVETVIDPHGRTLDDRHHLIRHDAHQGHGKKAVGHRRAERSLAFGALGIDMDELVVLDHIRIDIDPLLIDQMP